MKIQFLVDDSGSVYTGPLINRTVPKWVRLGLVFQQELLELFQKRQLTVPK